MKAVVVRGPDTLEWEERPLPIPGEGEVRIRTAYCGVCATDLEMLRRADRAPYPFILGHEWSGVVDALGPGAPPSLLGTPCVGDNILPCGRCAACAEGRTAACECTEEVGFERPGGYAQYFITRAAHLRPLKNGLPLDAATLVEPLAVVFRGMGRIATPRPRSALVVGAGPIGLLAVLLLCDAGVRPVVVIGSRAARLALAREYGAAEAFCHRDPPARLEEFVRREAPGGFALSVEATGTLQGFETAMRFAGKDSEVLLFGDYGSACASVPLLSLILREVRITPSNTGLGGWDGAVAFFRANADRLRRMVTHRFPARGFRDALAAARARGEDVIKVVLDWTAT